MLERSRSEILSRTQHLIQLGEWLERNEPIIAQLTERLSESVDLYLDDEVYIDESTGQHFTQLANALYAVITNLSDYKESVKSTPNDLQLTINYPWHCRSIKHTTVVLDEQQSKETTKS